MKRTIAFVLFCIFSIIVLGQGYSSLGEFPSNGGAPLGDALTSGAFFVGDTSNTATEMSTDHLFFDPTLFRLGLGTGATETTVTIGGVSLGSSLSVHSEGATDLAGLSLHRHSNTAGYGSHLIGVRSRGTEATETAVQSGDNLLRLYGLGFDGTDYEIAGGIEINVNATPGSNDMPGNIKFYVTPDGSATTSLVGTMTSDGLSIGSATGLGANNKFQVYPATDGINAIIGNTVIGYDNFFGLGLSSFSNYAQHIANPLTGFAVAQFPAGDTYINSGPGTPLYFSAGFASVAVMTAGTFALTAGNSFQLNGATSGSLTITPPAVITTHTLTPPAALGAKYSVLSDDTGTGGLMWSLLDNDNISDSAAILHSKMAALSPSTLAVTDASGYVTTQALAANRIPYGTGSSPYTSSANLAFNGSALTVNYSGAGTAGLALKPSATNRNGLDVTGLSGQTADLVAISTNGPTQVAGFDSAGKLKIPNGAVGAATGSIYGISDTNTGFLWNGSDRISGFAGGTAYFQISASGVTVNNGYLDVPVGTAASPTFTFTGDTDNGMFKETTNTVGFAAGGTQYTRIDSNGTTNIAANLRTNQGTATTTFVKVGGTAKVNTTTVGNVGAGEDDLMTYSLPANSLATNGDYIEGKAAITFAANANNKRVRCYFGATAMYDSTAQAQNGGAMEVTWTIVRTGATTQRVIAKSVSTSTLFTDDATYTTPGETLSGAVTIKCTGEATSNDDVQQTIMINKWFPNN